MSAPESPTRILHLEDDPADARLIGAILEDEIPCRIELARGEEEFSRALETGAFEVVLSDYSLPSFSGKAALELVKRRLPGTPFIYVSGTIGEEAAVEALLDGATDYVLKGNLRRLAPAIRRVRREVEERRERERLAQELRDTALQLQQAQKMEALGRLAGGVAHDFNNLLTAILGLSELSIKTLPQEDSVRKDLQEIKNTALRAAALTRQLLAFSRKEEANPRPIDMREIARGLEKMLARLIESSIDVRMRLPDSPAVVLADPGQMEQVLLNLALNARDAMPKGGALTVEIRPVLLDGEFLARHPAAAPGEHVLLRVSDDGEGMSEEVKAHAFEPFFSTKEPGKGTGLGLATCYGIVEQSDGYIAVESAPGEGTSVSVYLPRAAGEAGPLRTPADSRQALRGDETVLVAEDDAALRRLTARILRMQGYAVVEAADGRQALGALQADATGDIRLVLADTVMPHFGGAQLAEQIAALRPGVRVLLTSGYLDRTPLSPSLARLGAGFLAKPFEPEELAQKVRDVLDGRKT